MSQQSKQNKNELQKLSDSDSEEQDQPINEMAEENDYGAAEYWENRYKNRNQERFQWLVNYQMIKEFMEAYLKGDHTKKILNLGCGNAKIQDQMYEQGYKLIWNNDISKIVIEQMQAIKKQKQYDEMVYQVMDVTQMSYPDQQFDLVLDKSTIDALLCSENPYLNTAKMIEHVYRVLRHNGVYLVISYGQPNDRLLHLTREHVNFKVEVRKLEKVTEHGKVTHWAYICLKESDKEWKASDQKWREQFYENLKLKELEDYK